MFVEGLYIPEPEKETMRQRMVRFSIYSLFSVGLLFIAVALMFLGAAIYNNGGLN